MTYEQLQILDLLQDNLRLEKIMEIQQQENDKLREELAEWKQHAKGLDKALSRELHPERAK